MTNMLQNYKIFLIFTFFGLITLIRADSLYDEVHCNNRGTWDGSKCGCQFPWKDSPSENCTLLQKCYDGGTWNETSESCECEYSYIQGANCTNYTLPGNKTCHYGRAQIDNSNVVCYCTGTYAFGINCSTVFKGEGCLSWCKNGTCSSNLSGDPYIYNGPPVCTCPTSSHELLGGVCYCKTGMMPDPGNPTSCINIPKDDSGDQSNKNLDTTGGD